MEKSSAIIRMHTKSQVLLLIKGLVLGLGFIVPGISGGTIMMAFGLYEDLISDFLALRIKPYISMGIGSLIGIFLGSHFFVLLFESYRNPTSGFILGCVLMSIPFVLKKATPYGIKEIFLLAIGVMLAYLLLGTPVLINGSQMGGERFLLSGFISSASMMIPGISGSAMLILIGFYEETLVMINELQLINMTLFGIGGLAGVFTIAKALKFLFSKCQSMILFFFSGLILGSSKLIMPTEFDLLSIGTFLLGISLVYYWGNYKYKQSKPLFGRTIQRIKR